MSRGRLRPKPQKSGALVALISDTGAEFTEIPFANLRDTGTSFVKQMARMGQQFDPIEKGQLRLLQVKTIDEELEMITQDYTLFGSDLPPVRRIHQIGTIDSVEDDPNVYKNVPVPSYQYQPGRLYSKKDGGLLLESYSPRRLYDIPVPIIKTQREFGLTEKGEIIHFSPQYNSYSSLSGDITDQVTDFAVCQADNDNERVLVLLINNYANLVTCSIQQGQAIVTKRDFIGQSASSVYSHWNIPYIVFYGIRGRNVYVYDIRTRAIDESLDLDIDGINGISEPGSFPISKEGGLDQDGKVIAAVYTDSETYILRYSDPPRWEQLGPYKSLTSSSLRGYEFLYGLKM